MSTHTHFQRETLRFVEESSHTSQLSPKARTLFRRTFVASLILTTLTGFTGCGKKQPERAQVFPVEGQLLVDGKPLADVQIFFHPKSKGENSLSARAQTDKDGKFKVSTYDAGDGAVPGEYAVTAQHYTIIKTPDGAQRGPSDLPEKFASVKTTDWVIKVAEQPNTIPPKTIKR